MTSPTSAPAPAFRHRGPVVGLLVVLWVGGLCALAWWWFTIAMRQWAASYSDEGRELASLHRQASQVGLAVLLVAAGGPALIALVAYGMRLVRTAVVFLVLAVVLGVPALVLAGPAYRDLRPPPPPPPSVPGHCVELSGGDTRCPGG